MLNEVPTHQPDLWAECIKNLVSVGSALIVTAYVALAQFSHQSGQLSALQSKTFFKYIFPPWESALGFLLLLVACALTTDNAGIWMKSISLTAFLGAGILHGKTLKRMYTWSAGSQVSHAFVGQETRPYYIRKWLTEDKSTSSDEKAVLIYQHFENAGKAASGADKKYAITLFQNTTLQLLSQYVQVVKSEGAIDKMLESLAERLSWMLHYSRLMYGLSPEAIDVWHSVDFVRSLARQVRDIPNAHSAPLYAIHGHLTWLNRQIGGEDSVNLWRYKLYFDALIEEARHDYPPGLKSYTDAKSLLSMGLLCSVFDAVGTLGYNLKIPTLASALDRKDVSVFGVFVRRCLVDHVRNLHSRGRVDLESPVRGLFASHLEDVSLNHLLRLIRLEGDILNTHADSFIDACAETSGGDGMVMLVNPPDDAQSEVRRVGKERRENAEYFYIPSSRTARDLGLLADMRAAVEKRLESATGKNDDMAIAKAEETLRFLKEHIEFVQARTKK
jgi:hypothetical protein